MAASSLAHAISTTAAAARSLLQSVAEAIDDDDTAAIIVETETDLPAAIDAAVERIATIDAHVDALTARIAKLQDRKARLSTQKDTIRRALVSAMETTGTKRLECASATITLKTLPRTLVITDPDAIPASYLIQPPPVPDKKRLLDAIKSGEFVVGAGLSNGGLTVQIKES